MANSRQASQTLPLVQSLTHVTHVTHETKHHQTMGSANNTSKDRFEYVKSFEQPDILLPNTWIVVRIDGRGFTKLCARYGFEKPNDKRALDLMNAAAKAVMSDITDITIAYGVSDEFR